VCPEYQLSFGTYDPVTGELEAEYYPGNDAYYATIHFNRTEPGGDYCDDPVTLTQLDELISGPNSEGPYYGYRIWNQAGSLIYYHENQPPSVPLANVGVVGLLNDDNTFTMQIAWEQP
jgi:hypothetical protein